MIMKVTETITSQREELFTKLYLQVFPRAARYLQKRGANLEETRDIFQEALLAYYEKTVIDQVKITTSDQAYLMGIVKNIWLKQTKQPHQYELGVELPLADADELIPATDILLTFIKQTSQRCLDLLQAFYYEKLNMQSLASQFGFKSERSATVQKYKCLEKVREQVKQKSLSYEDFLA